MECRLGWLVLPLGAGLCAKTLGDLHFVVFAVLTLQRFV
jgi:hypothetical protein